ACRTPWTRSWAPSTGAEEYHGTRRRGCRIRDGRGRASARGRDAWRPMLRAMTETSQPDTAREGRANRRAGQPGRGGAEGDRRRARREGQGVRQLPWRNVVNPYAPIDVLDPEQLEKIHEASLRVLEELGLEFMNETALDILAAAGADVDRASRCVRF